MTRGRGREEGEEGGKGGRGRGREGGEERERGSGRRERGDGRRWREARREETHTLTNGCRMEESTSCCGVLHLSRPNHLKTTILLSKELPRTTRPNVPVPECVGWWV